MPIVQAGRSRVVGALEQHGDAAGSGVPLVAAALGSGRTQAEVACGPRVDEHARVDGADRVASVLAAEPSARVATLS